MQPAIGAFLAQFRPFCFRLLHSVFAEQTVAGIDGQAYRSGRMGFSDGNQANLSGAPAMGTGGIGNGAFDLG